MNDQSISTEIIEVIPVVMRSIRAQMRGLALPELSIAQFRIMSKLDQSSQSNKVLAEWIGVSTAAMSRTIEGLVRRHLVKRVFHPNDRREVILSLTPKGKRKYQSIQDLTRKKIQVKLAKCSANQKKTLHDGLSVLREVFYE